MLGLKNFDEGHMNSQVGTVPNGFFDEGQGVRCILDGIGCSVSDTQFFYADPDPGSKIRLHYGLKNMVNFSI
jgi:hypothetical protein